MLMGLGVDSVRWTFLFKILQKKRASEIEQELKLTVVLRNPLNWSVPAAGPAHAHHFPLLYLSYCSVN